MKTTLCTLTLAMNLATGLSSGLRSNAMDASATTPDYSAATGVSTCDESLSGKSQDGYRGCQTKTENGRTCQKWTDTTPQMHTRDPDDPKYAGKGIGDHNYCRNPDDEPLGIWCYTTDPKTRWEYCDPVRVSQVEHAADLAAKETLKTNALKAKDDAHKLVTDQHVLDLAAKDNLKTAAAEQHVKDLAAKDTAKTNAVTEAERLKDEDRDELQTDINAKVADVEQAIEDVKEIKLQDLLDAKVTELSDIMTTDLADIHKDVDQIENTNP